MIDKGFNETTNIISDIVNATDESAILVSENILKYRRNKENVTIAIIITAETELLPKIFIELHNKGINFENNYEIISFNLDQITAHLVGDEYVFFKIYL